VRADEAEESVFAVGERSSKFLLRALERDRFGKEPPHGGGER